MKKLVLAAALVTPLTAVAQPYSESMADCAALFQNAAQWVQSDENSDKLMHAARTWAAAAVEQSHSEGRPVSSDVMWDKIDAKTENWEAKGPSFFLSEEFRDWTGYCRAFGRDRGIELNL